MNKSTRSALIELNRQFYSRFASGFDASRRRPWVGWNRLLDWLDAPARDALRILDLGCGNGRFAGFLETHWPGKIDYLGVDSSPQLLEAAGARNSKTEKDRRLDLRFWELEITGVDLAEVLEGERFDLVGLFGILHHVPGRDARADLVRRAAACLAPRGILAASLWQFDRQDRFAAKLVPWDEHNRRSRAPIDVSELEDGDFLLTWAGERETPRYCHLAGEKEMRNLVDATELPLLESFSADGPDGDRNLYFAVQRLC